MKTESWNKYEDFLNYFKAGKGDQKEEKAFFINFINCLFLVV